jgi:membrane protease YdiL (CAAX protease family)
VSVRARTAYLTYGGLSVAWVTLVQGARALPLGTIASFVVQHLAIAAAVMGVALALPPRAVGGLLARRGAGWTWAVATAAGVPPLVAVAVHVVADPSGWLVRADAAAMALKILVNQGVLEEVLARGLLLGALVRQGTGARRAIWGSSLAFGLMHLVQFGFPPYSLARLANGIFLVLVTVPVGAALAQLTVRARSLWPAVWLHFLIDLTLLPQAFSRPMTLVILAAVTLTVLLVPALVWLVDRSTRT